jgi:hypothetical protein
MTLSRLRLPRLLRYPFDTSAPANDNCWLWSLGPVRGQLASFLRGAL